MSQSLSGETPGAVRRLSNDKVRAEPRLSASLLLVNAKNEVLVIQRTKESSSFPGMHVSRVSSQSMSLVGSMDTLENGKILYVVSDSSSFQAFPGGNYDSLHDGALSPRETMPVTAIRETFEETGILLACPETQKSPVPGPLELSAARRGIHSRSDPLTFSNFLGQYQLSIGDIKQKLIPFSQWVTPANAKARFWTWFYVAFLDELEGNVHISSEVQESSIEGGLSPATQEVVGTADLKRTPLSFTPSDDGQIEVTSTYFQHPKLLLESFRLGKISLMPPQFYLLTMLSDLLDMASVVGKNEESTTPLAQHFREFSVPFFGSRVFNPRFGGRVKGRDGIIRSALMYEGDQDYERPTSSDVLEAFTLDPSQRRWHRSLICIMSHDPRRPHRQDTFDLRDQILTDAAAAHQHHPQAGHHQQQHGDHEDEEHSILEDDSEAEDDQDEFMEDDDSSSLSIPNESIDFDLVYSLHTFVATVEGQANVVKGDSLFLMDDSNSYWWLVRVLKTQEVGYIPAENIETPFERLARLNKHRNVDLAAPLPEENPSGFRQPQIQPSNSRKRNISFRGSTMFHYPPAVWNEEEEGWEEDDYEAFDTGLDHPLNDEEDWDDDSMEQEWDEIGANGSATGEMSFASKQDTPPLALQQPPRPQPQQQSNQSVAQQPYSQDSHQRPAQQVQQQAQQNIQYAQQDPRTLQQQDSIQSLQGSNSSIHQQGSNASLRQKTSKERLSPSDPRANNSPDSNSPGPGGSPSNTGGPKVFDPDSIDANETRKISATPSVARDQPYVRSDGTQASSGANGPLLPSAILAQQENERKRVREELEEETRKRKQREGSERSPSQQSNRSDASKGGSKLVKNSGKDAQAAKDKERAERERAERESEERDGGKKNRGVFGGLFKRKDKEKPSDKASGSSRRTDDDYSRSGSISASDEGGQISGGRSGYSTERPGQPAPGHGRRVQEIDMKHQTAYQRSVQNTPGNAAPQPSYATQSAATFLPGGNNGSNAKYGGGSMKTNTSQGQVSQFGERSNTLKPGSNSGNNMPMGSPGSSSGHQRPGSLILTAPGIGFEGGASVPELSVMRVFAGSSLSTEATFKTVLLNASTTSSDLVKQAMQRFRVAAGEDADDYYLTVKTVEGSFTTLQPHEKPLVVFEEMVESNARDDILPTVKRSSITSISSLTSNLSMHSAIRRLPMNDFTDDSAVKFYLNRYDAEGKNAEGHRGKNSLGGGDEFWPEGGRHESLLSMGTTTDEDAPTEGLSTVASTSSNLAANDRFTSPTSRFALQLVIYPDDLPDGMVFDPHTEAIIPKATLKDRTPLSSSASPGIPQTFRRKVFMFPKNTTVAEVIELGLERFGISEGVVDGGDEVEDKNVKRRSASRVRYCLSCLSDGQEKELRPASKILDAFSRPPSFRLAEQRRSADGKRRSADATMLLGSVEDINPEDPTFILRRAVAYPMNNAPRSKLSAPLDDLALRHSHLQAQRESITASEASTNKDDDTMISPATPRPGAVGASVASRAPPAQLSRQEIIAAQRAASRANQRAIISAHANPEQGVDILLPDKATIRSSRIGADDGFRYSYILPDGEKFDISQYMEEEWPDHQDSHKEQVSSSGSRNDLLEGVLGRHGVAENGQQTIGEKIDRVLNKLKGNPQIVGTRVISGIYSDKDVVIPPARPQRSVERAPSRSGTPNDMAIASKNVTQRSTSTAEHRPNQASIDSSEMSAYESTTSTPNKLDHIVFSKPKTTFDGANDSPNRSMLDEGTEEDHYLPPASTRKRPLLVLKDHDFGLSRMMAVIEMNAAMRAPAPWQKQSSRGIGRQRLRRQHSLLTSQSIVDDVLFGPTMDMEELHPRVREIFEPVAKQLEALDKQIDELFLGSLRLSNRA
ncbi:hypothetical protein FRC17_000078 [Serendipita sp. 399]|nr:hypothetical protein FRC17_000078 [Serendipita sp. 399]